MTPDKILHSPDITKRILMREATEIAEEYYQWMQKHEPNRERTIENAYKTVFNVVQELDRARRVYWSPELYRASLRDAGEAFRDQLIPEYLYDEFRDAPQWWLTDHPFMVAEPELMDYYGLDEPKSDEETFRADGFLLLLDSTGTDIYSFILLVIEEPFTHAILRSMPWIHSPAHNEWSQSNLAQLHFMHLPFVGSEHIRPSRAVRRQAQRENRELPEIRVVHLRKSALPREGSPAPEGYDWHHHWIVNGHWRKQWYPKKSEHKPVYIAPYVKGDLNKPLLSRPTVYKVVR
jgi:hypothetical protein